MLVKSDAFRPIKLEGNPEHPMSKGKSDAFTQATLLDLYDPDRSQHVLFRGERVEWGEFQEAFATAVAETNGGDGRLLPERDDHLADAGGAVEAGAGEVSAGEAGAVGAGESGLRAARRRRLRSASYYDAQYKLEDADVILSLDADFLGGIALPGLPADGGGVCRAAPLRRRQDDEPDVRRRDACRR